MGGEGGQEDALGDEGRRDGDGLSAARPLRPKALPPLLRRRDNCPRSEPKYDDKLLPTSSYLAGNQGPLRPLADMRRGLSVCVRVRWGSAYHPPLPMRKRMS